MRNMTLKRKLFIGLILLIVLLVYRDVQKLGLLERTTRIFEIENTGGVYGGKEDKNITIVKHYMIIKPPKDLHELKIVAEKFLKENLKEEEFVVEKNQIRHFQISFYRVSRTLPKDWQPNEAYMDTDRIEHHKDDLIVSVVWSNLHPQKRYSIIRKSRTGEVIEEIQYIGDRVE